MSSLSYPVGKAHEPYCHLARLARPYFSTYPITGTIFRGWGISEHKICSFNFFCSVCRKQLILRRIQRDIMTNVMYRYACAILKKLEFLPNTQISNFVKIRRLGAKLFHAGGRADTQDEANSRFLAIMRKRLKIQFPPHQEHSPS